MSNRKADEDREEREEEEAIERSAPGSSTVYKAILKEGEDELQRSTGALFWSGLAAGLSMGFSLICEGLLRAHLPDTEWRPLVTKFGYSVGFLIVVLGRQQLFTENTLTPILPLLSGSKGASVANVLRLWGAVLVANLIGGVLIAWGVGTNAFDPTLRAAFTAIGFEAMRYGFWTVLWRGIFAGWLIALMVWLLPFAETGRIWVIIIITYVVGLAGFSHVIAGSIEVFALAAAGEKSWGAALGMYVVPALIGNVLGGVTLVAAINHAQMEGHQMGKDS